MFKFKKVKIGRYFIGKITDLIFFIMQILHFYKEKRSDYGVEIFEYFYLPWKNDVEFNHIYQEVKNNTLNPKSRLYTIYSLAKKYLNEGDSFIEVGTWKGGVPALVSKISSISNLDIFACDTFNGVANASGNDTFFQNGEYSDTSTQIVADIVNTENCNLSIIEGVFPESFKFINFK